MLIGVPLILPQRKCSSQIAHWKGNVDVVPIGMEEAPKAALNIHCLQLGGGAALT